VDRIGRFGALAAVAPFGLAIALLAPESARANEVESSRAAAERYFRSENLYNGLYVAVGSTNAAIGAALVTRDDSGVRAAGYPLIAVGGIQLVVGVVYLALTPGWRRDAFHALALGHQRFLTSQRERIRSVERGFLYYELIDGAAAATGFGIGLAGAIKQNDVLAGVGTGLGTVAFAQLTMDLITHEVAKHYLAELERPTAKGAVPGSVRARPKGLGLRLSF
jgi:hypothetical protein